MPEGEKQERNPDLKFSGGRYESRGFPLDGIHELQRYQTLLTEIAKQIWRKNHPGKNLPAKFADRVRLRLVDIKSGSVDAYLEAVDVLEIDGVPGLLDRTRDYLNETFASIVNGFSLPSDASPGLKSALRMIGTSFEADESITLRPGTDNPIRFGVPEHRRLLAILDSEMFTRTGTLVGALDNLSAKGRFTMFDGEGREIRGNFTTEGVWEALHELHNLAAEADLIWLECDYSVSETDQTVTRIYEVRDANLFAHSDDRWAVRLARFAALPEGRLDGEGERIEVASLSSALEVLTKLTENNWKEPAIFPDIDGGVRMEWLTTTSHTLLSVDNDVNYYGYHYDSFTKTEKSADFTGVDKAIAFVEEFIGG